MKYRKLIAALVTAAFSMASGVAQAADNHTITVNASVPGNCKFTSNTSTVTFTLDASLTSVVTLPASIGYRCTKSTAPSFTYASTSSGLSGSGTLANGGTTDTITYTYNTPATGPAGSGLGGGVTPETLTVNISIDQSTTQNVTPSLTYSDTIAVTLNP